MTRKSQLQDEMQDTEYKLTDTSNELINTTSMSMGCSAERLRANTGIRLLKVQLGLVEAKKKVEQLKKKRESRDHRSKGLQ